MSAIQKFVEILNDNRTGKASGIYSICSAQETVLEAAMRQAKNDGSILLIESTSNQVDQFGGYTGMKPADFVAYVHGIGARVGFAEDDILLGGDHLGPNPWQQEPAESAMTKAHELIREYIKAGYLKIHLDASMYLADDPGDRHEPLADAIVAARAAALCRSAEEAHEAFRAGQPKPVYIIGTEVPIPGGAQEEEEVIRPTSPADAARTIEVTRAAFEEAGLSDAWERVCGLVVQPGVEFGDDQVFHYNREAAAGLSAEILNHERLVYEAHSTDYQTEKGLCELVEDHFCILKVGPWVTFGYREALFALAQIEEEMLSSRGLQTSRLREVVESVMIEEPLYWQKYYPGNAIEQEYKRKYSFSDRSRYYWLHPRIVAARDFLVKNLLKYPVTMSMLSQYMPNQYAAVSEGMIKNDVQQIILHRTQDVIRIYARACRMRR